MQSLRSCAATTAQQDKKESGDREAIRTILGSELTRKFKFK
jgi:hypothetical protein